SARSAGRPVVQHSHARHSSDGRLRITDSRRRSLGHRGLCQGAATQSARTDRRCARGTARQPGGNATVMQHASITERRLGDIAPRIMGLAGAIGIGGIVVSLLVAAMSEGGWERFFRSYLFAFMFI